MLLGTLVASLLGNLLSGKGIVRAGYGSKMEIKWILNAASSVNKLWNNKILSKRT